MTLMDALSDNKADVDGQRLQDVLDCLNVSAYSLAKELGYKSHQTIYHVLKGKNGLSEGLIKRLVQKYPQVNIKYLQKGELPVELDSSETQNQMNLLGITPPASVMDTSFLRLAQLPSQLDRVESMLSEIMERLDELESKS